MLNHHSNPASTLRHRFSMTYSQGWWQCCTIGCDAYAICPGCLGCVLTDAVVVFCEKHMHLLPYLGDYERRTYAPSVFRVCTGSLAEYLQGVRGGDG